MTSNCIATHAEVGVQVEILRPSAAATLLRHQSNFLDLGMKGFCSPPKLKYADEPIVQGYDSLHSTPKQQPQPPARPAEKVELESNNDTDENVSNNSLDNSIRWMDSFSLLKKCKIFSRIHLRSRPDDEKMRPVDDQSTGGEEGRVEWDKKMDFLLSIIGFAVDLANVRPSCHPLTHSIPFTFSRSADSRFSVTETAAGFSSSPIL